MPKAIQVVIAIAETAVGKVLISIAIKVGISALQARLKRSNGSQACNLQTQVCSASADRMQYFGRGRNSGATASPSGSTVQAM